MSNDSSGLRDEARAELNHTDTEDTPIEDLDPDWDEDEIARRQTQQPDPIPSRPADGAAKAKWVDYCVALGADRASLVGETEHYDPDAEVTRTRQVPVLRNADADPDYFEDLGDLIETGLEDGESADDFADRMRAQYEAAQRRAAEREPVEYREETVTERGGYVKSKALSRDELIELADRLGG